MTARQRRWVQGAAAAAILFLLVRTVGGDAFVDGLRMVDLPSLAFAAVAGLVATVCCAWRWHLVARGLGQQIPIPGAVAACYRAQLINTTLPGGVLGDVHRGIRQGRATGHVGRGLRAVGWERTAGQAVQVVATLGLLLVLPSPVHRWAPYAAAGALAVTVTAVMLAHHRHPRGGVLARGWGAVVDDIRSGLLAVGVWPGVLLTSLVIVTAHTATFVVAAHAAGANAPLRQLLPLALLVLAASAVPTNLAGWGPREGMSAWAFSAAGLGAGLGVRAAVVFGVMTLVSALPGLVAGPGGGDGG